MFKRVLLVYLRDDDAARAQAWEVASAYRALAGNAEGLLRATAQRPDDGDCDLVIELCFRSETAMRLLEESADYRALYARLEAVAERIDRSAFGEYGYAAATPQADEYPMKWHKFLIYFALWAGAILNGVSGISTLFSCFGGEYAAVYDIYPALLGLDVFGGLCLIGIAVFQIITRNALARFSRKAPQMVVWLYASTVILSVLQVVAVWLVSGVGLSYVMTPDMWVILIEGALMTWANQVYYRKRASMFVN